MPILSWESGLPACQDHAHAISESSPYGRSAAAAWWAAVPSPAIAPSKRWPVAVRPRTPPGRPGASGCTRMPPDLLDHQVPASRQTPGGRRSAAYRRAGGGVSRTCTFARLRSLHLSVSTLRPSYRARGEEWSSMPSIVWAALAFTLGGGAPNPRRAVIDGVSARDSSIEETSEGIGACAKRCEPSAPPLGSLNPG